MIAEPYAPPQPGLAVHRKIKARRSVGILGRLLFHPSKEIDKEEKESRAGSE